jgi:D-psicose/D-tagatose/L-ribulose 3-epimerase
MPVGFSMLLWTTHVGAAHAPILRALKGAGYDGAEVPVTGLTLAEAGEVGRMVADIGLRATASGGVTGAEVDPLSDDSAVRMAAVDHLRRLVDRAVAMGAEVLIGPYVQPLGQFIGRGPLPEEMERLAQAHRAMADHAGAALTLAVEPLNRFECWALNTGAQAAALVEAVGRDNYGWLYDTFHANIEERDPVGVIGAARPSYVHISENDRGVPGRGHIDFAAVFAALEAIGHDGWVTVEAFGQALPELAAATRIWRPLFDSEAQVYEEAIGLIRRYWN